MKKAFSLVELSIVLVILGLLTGGILGGQSLIRAAELRSVSTDYARYATAIYSFRDKYFAIPGDMSNATAFWGKDAASCNGDIGTAMVPGACNGNGDGIVYTNVVAGAPTEQLQAWKHLALAGLIEGSFTGLEAPGTGGPTPGVNVPRGRISSTNYTLLYENYVPGDAFNTAMNYGNRLDFGGASSFHSGTPALRPEEAWNIDTKMDDGRPGQGRLMAVYWDDCSTAANFNDLNGEYALSVSGVVCSLRFKNVTQ